MKIIKTLLLAIIVFFSFDAKAQDRAEIDNTNTAEVSEIFIYKPSVSNFLQLRQVSPINTLTNQNTNSANFNNIAIIEQVGSNNFVQADNFSGTSRLFYVQEGDRNSIVNQNNLDTTVTQRIIQQGNDNAIRAISSGNLDIIQSGNGIIYEQIGTNPITNNLQLRFTGNARTIAVRTISVSNNTNSNN